MISRLGQLLGAKTEKEKNVGVITIHSLFNFAQCQWLKQYPYRRKGYLG
jgi:hypothetical protein